MGRTSKTTRRTLILGSATALITVGAIGSYTFARNDFSGDTLTPQQAHALAKSGEITLIDIRRPDEWKKTGLPEGGVGIDMRRDDFVAALLAQLGGDSSRPVALICARGVRSDRTSARLQAAGFTRVIDVPEGMLGSRAGAGWLKRGLPVVAP